MNSFLRNVRSRARFATVALAALVAACGGGAPKELHVFVWANYLDPEVTAEFERDAGVKVVESNYSSNEDMRAKLQAGGSGYDLVCPTDYTVVQLVGDGLLLPIDKSHIPNLKNLAPRFQAPAYDPKLVHSVPFQWGVTGIGYDATKVATPPKSWREFFDAAKAGTFGKVSLLDDMREVLGAALLAQGRSPNTKDAAEIAAARDLVKSAAANVERFDSDDPGTGIAQGQIALAQGWSGMFANGRRDDARVAFLVPSEGAFTYVDNWAVPKGARDQALAERFIDFCLRPEIAAKLVAKKLYASTNGAADALIDPAILKGFAYADGAGAKLWWVEDAGTAGDAYAEAWSAIKAE